MRALAGGRLQANQRLTGHLDLCLSCRSCEAVCPAQVPYERLLDAARTLIVQQQSPGWRARLAWRTLGDGLIAKPLRLEFLGRWLYRYQRSFLDRWLRASGVLRLLGLQRWYNEMPALPPQQQWRKTYYPATADHRGDVDLFIGCVARITDADTLRSVVTVLNAFGYGVRIPPEQTCCGALHLHGGRSEAAHALMKANLSAHAPQRLPVITAASGCAATLKEYGEHIADTGAADFGARVIDFSAFIDNVKWRGSPVLDDTVVAVHEPCTLRNVMKTTTATYRVLERIQGLHVVPLADNRSCCGAAGIYFLTQPEMSQRLLADKIDAIRTSGASIVVTSNIGCGLHLATGLREAKLAVEVLHPAQLLDRALANG